MARTARAEPGRYDRPAHDRPPAAPSPSKTKESRNSERQRSGQTVPRQARRKSRRTPPAEFRRAWFLPVSLRPQPSALRIALANHAHKPVPAREIDDSLPGIVFLSESIIRQLGNIGGRRLPQREVNNKRPSHDVVLRHESPVTAVAAEIAIVSEHEIFIWRYHQIAATYLAPHLHPPARIDPRIGVQLRR